MKENACLLLLHSCKGIGPIYAKKLLQTFGSALSILQAKPVEWSQKAGLNSIQVKELSQAKTNMLNAKKMEVEAYEKKGIRLLSYLDKDFPVRLKQWVDCPILLFVKGRINLNPNRTIAVIGTRKPTAASIQLTKQFIQDSKPFGAEIISGLAYGIDITAHRECIQQQIATQSVLAHGLDQIYPKAHAKESTEICRDGGLITEMPWGTRLHPDLFPRRNRIVAGLSDVVVVIESKLIGGSMSTAQIAMSYNREVCAFPGNPAQGHNSGCNALIKRNVAHLIESFEDVSKIMKWNLGPSLTPQQTTLLPELNQDESCILNALTGQQMHIDQLIEQTGIPLHRLTLSTLELELKGVIQVLPGKYYQRAI